MTLTTLRPLIHIIAAERTHTRPDLFDDAVQEGLISAWQASVKNPDAPRQYLTAAARNGVTHVLQGRSMTGAPSRQGRREPLDDSSSLTFDDDADDTTSTVADPSADDALTAVLDTVHAPDVRTAVAGLPPTDAELVTLRFGADLSWPQVATRMGRRTEAVRRRFTDHIAPALRVELAHLDPAA